MRALPLVLLGLAACARSETDSPTVPEASLVAASGPDGPEFLGVIVGARGTFAAPLVSRSERVARIARGEPGVAFRLLAGEGGIERVLRVDASALRHPADHHVLGCVGTFETAGESGGDALLVGPPILPARVVTERGSLAHLARRDGSVIRGGRVEIHAPPDLPPGAALFLIPGEGASPTTSQVRVDGEPSFRPFAPSPRRVPLDGDVVVVDLDEETLDQAFFASSREIGEAELIALPFRGMAHSPGHVAGWQAPGGRGPARPIVEPLAATATPTPGVLAAGLGRLEAGELLESWFEAPGEADDGETWTVFVHYELTGGTDSSRVEPPDPPSAGPLHDVAHEAGIDFVHLEGPDEQLDIRPTMGPGAAWGDVDGDGWVDLYLVQGGGREGSDPLPNRLYLNRGDGTFEDVTATSGTGDGGAGMGALFFDADGDRDLDLYVANYGRDVLYVNDGAGVFRDGSTAAGLELDLWSASVAASDFDGDGDLDLYVTSYLDYDPAKMPPADELGRYQREDPVEMLPFAFPGERNVLLRNETRGADAPRFVDATEELGLADVQGRGMQSVFWDFDRDGDDDLYVANDVSFNVLFRNDGGTFTDVSFSTGLDDPRGGMGLAIGDVDRDGDEDLFLTNWELEANALYLNNAVTTGSKHRRSSFRDGTVASGLGPAGIGATSWGSVLFDAENDGDLDLFVANGYTSPDYESTGICVGQPNHFFRSEGGAKWTDASANVGPDIAVELASRGAVACDYDQNGAVDIVVTANNGPVQLLRNEFGPRGAWLGVRLRGAGGNTFGIGAHVTVRTDTGTFDRSLRAGTGYLTGNPPELHFGLGDAKRVEEVRIRWPSGRETTHEAKLGAWVVLEEN